MHGCLGFSSSHNFEGLSPGLTQHLLSKLSTTRWAHGKVAVAAVPDELRAGLIGAHNGCVCCSDNCAR